MQGVLHSLLSLSLLSGLAVARAVVLEGTGSLAGVVMASVVVIGASVVVVGMGRAMDIKTVILKQLINITGNFYLNIQSILHFH